MPQRQTTHKDLHRAALGSALSLVYLLVISPAYAENSLHEKAKLVKTAPFGASSAAKPTAAPPAAIPAAQAKAPATQAKVARLREIPLSTLNADREENVGNGTRGTRDTRDPKDTKQGKYTKDTKTSDTSKAKSGSAKDDGQAKAEKTEPAKSSNKAAVVKRTKTTASTPRLNNGLVPPPPPIVPIGMDALGMYAQPVDFLSLKELEGRKKELTARFNELDSTVSDAEKQIRERKERAELFESLYQEGVVSRKELETAKREAGEIGRDLKFKQDELESVKISMKAVNNRLAVLKKMEAKLNAGKKSDAPASKSAKKK